MEFLVRFEIAFPHDLPEEKQEHIRAEEREHGRRLWESGVMKRIWRIPGRWGAMVLYEMPDATALHEMLASLPLYPYMDITVETLAMHPFEADAPSKQGGQR